jgi:uncharacterized membrane protein
MKAIWKFIGRTLLGGLLVLLPAYLAILLIVKGVMGLTHLIKPLLNVLPMGPEHHALVSLLVVVAASFIVGLAVTTWPGRPLGRWIDNGLLDRIPGYTFIRSMLGRAFGEQSAEFRVAFIEFDDNTALGYVVEEHANGNFTVFLPSSPTPFSGSVLLMPAHRVHIVDVPFTQAFGSMTKWGTGMREVAKSLNLKPRDSAA